MAHWQDRFQQSQQGGLFLPQSPQVSRKQQVSPAVCPLCHQPHGREDQSGNHRPSVDDGEGWKQYWANKSQSWRTKPEISYCRQYELSQRRLIHTEPKKDIYPFSGMLLNRADVEWLLATHENGRGPINWDDENQRDREGLDLRGAHLEEKDLQGLPLARLRGGMDTFSYLLDDERKRVRISLTRANLSRTHLEGADFTGAQLEGAKFSVAHLEGADFTGAQLEGADFTGAQLETVQLTGVTLTNDKGVGPSVADVSWAGTNMSVIAWSDLVMLGDEDRAHQKDENGTKKDQATRLQEYRDAMRATHQLAVVLQDQGLTRDASRFVYRAKCLEGAVRWYELRTIIWQDPNSQKRTAKNIRKRLMRFFSTLFSCLFSWFLFLFAGYGYRLRFCFFWYFLVVLGCTFAYLLVEPHYFTWWTALGESVNVFHGRGASPNIPQLTHPARFAMLTVAEAWAGLVIEVVFVATLIQRFFGK